MTKKTNNKVILKSIIVVRDGRRVSPPIGKSFPLEDDEIEALDGSTKNAYRDAVNEDEAADNAEVVGLVNSAGHVSKPAIDGGAKGGKRGAGKTTALVDGADGAPVVDDL